MSRADMTKMQEIEERVGFAEEAVERRVGTTAWPSHYADDVRYLLKRLREGEEEAMLDRRDRPAGYEGPTRSRPPTREQKPRPKRPSSEGGEET